MISKIVLKSHQILKANIKTSDLDLDPVAVEREDQRSSGHLPVECGGSLYLPNQLSVIQSHTSIAVNLSTISPLFTGPSPRPTHYYTRASLHSTH